MKETTIACINKSWKFEGYLMVVLESGKEEKRKYTEYSKGRFAGKVTFQIFDNVYSFRNTVGWKEVQGSQITLEGRYVDLFKTNKTSSDRIKQEMATKGIQMPKVVELPPQQDNGEVKHEKYDEIKMCVENDIPVYLVGPAGSGKNHTLEQIANELGWNFYFSNSVQQEYKLTGFIDAGGNFHETEFYKACDNESDCIFFLDEMDASIPEVLVLLNAAIANGYFEFPNGKKSIKHVHFVAAGNTFGDGADEQYTGRLVLDQATLDRFAVIKFGYSIKIEMAISKNNSELVTFIRQLREDAERKGVRATFSYRCISMMVKLERAGMQIDRALEIAVFKGMDKDTVNTLRATGSGRYSAALLKLQRVA